MCLAQGPQRSDASEARSRGLSVTSQDSTTEPLRSLKALSHYNVLANVCRRMKYLSSTLAYAEI